jgi:uncharacterized protein (UPF0276 family)
MLENPADAGRELALATPYEGDDPALLERIVALVDAIEIAPDAIAQSRGGRATLRREVLAEYAAVPDRVSFIAHGVGLSIGSYDRWDATYLRLLDELFSEIDLVWHSEHLACTMVGGENVGSMLSLPYTEEALALVCARVAELQRRYPAPFLLEHAVRLLPQAPGDYSQAGFLNALTQRTGCGLILDAYNLRCDALNWQLDVDGFLSELDLTPVRELHVAGGVQYNGFQLDIHSRPIADDTFALALDIIERAPNLRIVTYEFLKEAVDALGHDAICAELSRLGKVIEQCRHSKSSSMRCSI